jgi:hypothetical protein
MKLYVASALPSVFCGGAPCSCRCKLAYPLFDVRIHPPA